MVMTSSAPARVCRVVGPVGYQMSSQMLTATTVVAEREDRRLRPRLEIPILVEDAVVRQVLLVVGPHVHAVVQHGGGVEDVVALVHEAEHRGEAAAVARRRRRAPAGWPR